MTVFITVFATLAAVVHLLFFVLESLLWRREAVWKLFGVRSAEDANVIRPMAFNQGFYNLFLAIGLLVGVFLYGAGVVEAGLALSCFTLLAMLGAAIVLLVTDRRLWIGAVLQGLLPLTALALFLAAQFLN